MPKVLAIKQKKVALLALIGMRQIHYNKYFNRLKLDIDIFAISV